MRSRANLEYSTQRVLCVLQLTLIEDLKYFTVPFPPAIARYWWQRGRDQFLYS